jgi:hypothetical protein
MTDRKPHRRPYLAYIERLIADREAVGQTPALDVHGPEWTA